MWTSPLLLFTPCISFRISSYFPPRTVFGYSRNAQGTGGTIGLPNTGADNRLNLYLNTGSRIEVSLLWNSLLYQHIHMIHCKDWIHWAVHYCWYSVIVFRHLTTITQCAVHCITNDKVVDWIACSQLCPLWLCSRRFILYFRSSLCFFFFCISIVVDWIDLVTNCAHCDNLVWGYPPVEVGLTLDRPTGWTS